MTKSLMSMDQLVKAANQRITELKIKPSHHKARSKITPRTVRYYLQNGYIREATRVSGQIRFSEDHLKAIIRLKSLQADGLFLKETLPNFEKGKNTRDFALVDLKIPSFRATSDQAERWSLRIDDDLLLTGTGPKPSPKEFEIVRPLLQLWQQNRVLKKNRR